MSEWTGPRCGMCNGTGKTAWHPADGETYIVTCPACNGHGREPF